MIKLDHSGNESHNRYALGYVTNQSWDQSPSDYQMPGTSSGRLLI